MRLATADITDRIRAECRIERSTTFVWKDGATGIGENRALRIGRIPGTGHLYIVRVVRYLIRRECHIFLPLLRADATIRERWTITHVNRNAAPHVGKTEGSSAISSVNRSKQ